MRRGHRSHRPGSRQSAVARPRADTYLAHRSHQVPRISRLVKCGGGLPLVRIARTTAAEDGGGKRSWLEPSWLHASRGEFRGRRLRVWARLAAALYLTALPALVGAQAPAMPACSKG